MMKFQPFLLRHAERLHGLVVLLAVVLVSSLELALAERKFGILFGGFGASQVIDTPTNFIAVFSQWLFVQTAAFIFLHMLLRWTLGKRWNGVLALIFCAVGLVLIPTALLLAKYQVLQYFGDAIGLDVVRRLGGGSLWDAVLYLGAEILSLLLGGVVLLAALVWLVKRLLRRDIPAAATRYRPGKRRWLTLAGLVAASVVAMVFSAGDKESKYLAYKFLAPALLRSAASQITDWDGDGYGYLALQTDPDPLNAAIYPLAYDVPDNGIDEDGYCGDFSAAPDLHATLARPWADPAAPLAFKHVVLVVLESTRSDVLSAQVDGKPIAPHLQRLAQRGSSTQAYSHAGFTVPSLISLFTGVLEPLGARPSLFDDLKARNFHIGVLSGQAENFGDIDVATNMRKQASVFVDAEQLKTNRVFSSTAKGSLRIDERDLFREFEKHYGKPQDWQKSNFIYLNFQSPHFPYYHPGMGHLVAADPLPRHRISPSHRKQLVQTYWNAVAWSDHWLGEIEKKLALLGVQQDVLLVVTADHGESLFDQGFLGHGHQINDIQTKIPLVLSQSGIALDGALGLMDLRNVILGALTGAPLPPAEGPVFQYLGNLESPSMVALVNHHGERTLLDTRSRKIDFGSGQGETDFDQLAGSLKEQGCKLVRLWEHHRLLSRQNVDPRAGEPPRAMPLTAQR